MNPQAFQRALGRLPQRKEFARFIPEAPKPLPREALMHYWYPGRDGVEWAPGRVQHKLEKIHRDLAIVRPPANAPVASRAWAVWYRKPEVTHPLSPGWMLFFVWQERRNVYTEDKGQVTTLVPLSLDDPRLFANIYRFSVFGDFKSARAHFENVVSQMRAEKDARTKADTDRRHDLAKEYWESTKIKNIGSGSKFARHHDGSVIPSRGDAAWDAERGTRDQPGVVTRLKKLARERQLDRRPR